MTVKTVCFRLPEEQKRELEKSGKLSDVLREGMKLYLNKMKSDALLRRLGELQAKNPAKMSSEEIVRMIREDRNC